jgi:hypothetical protein
MHLFFSVYQEMLITGLLKIKFFKDLVCQHLKMSRYYFRSCGVIGNGALAPPKEYEAKATVPFPKHVFISSLHFFSLKSNRSMDFSP